ncbi:hypothetical protein OIU85_017717 [Salix viminalis]|uniref:Uncharacterized protein n=1 Tax=Salix viminalis TaxID=40686 RepID=A0A9Q0V7Z2_SALVM|nr:hypothetical protein OIU85_017717 [Salix viminalis]
MNVDRVNHCPGVLLSTATSLFGKLRKYQLDIIFLLSTSALQYTSLAGSSALIQCSLCSSDWLALVDSSAHNSQPSQEIGLTRLFGESSSQEAKASVLLVKNQSKEQRPSIITSTTMLLKDANMNLTH